MKKKFYIQPQSNLMEMQGERLCDDLVVGSNGEAKGGVWGTPTRQVSGDSQGLKYLI